MKSFMFSIMMFSSITALAESRICTGGYYRFNGGISYGDPTRIIELTYDVDERGISPKALVIRQGDLENKKPKEVINSVTLTGSFLSGVPTEAPALGFKGVVYELGSVKVEDISDLDFIHKDDVKLKLYYPYTEGGSVFKSPMINFEQERATQFKPLSCKTVKPKKRSRI